LGNADKVRAVISALVIGEGISALAEAQQRREKISAKENNKDKNGDVIKKEKIEKIESVEGAEEAGEAGEAEEAEVEEVGKLKKVEKMEKLATEKKCLVITEHLHRFLHHLMGDMAHRFQF
jgi:hypothetical protein